MRHHPLVRCRMVIVAAKSIALFGLLAVMFVWSAQTIHGKKKYRYFRSDIGGYRVKIPSEWIVKEEMSDSGDYQATITEEPLEDISGE